jgi:hypothetical protein
MTVPQAVPQLVFAPGKPLIALPGHAQDLTDLANESHTSIVFRKPGMSPYGADQAQSPSPEDCYGCVDWFHF